MTTAQQSDMLVLSRSLKTILLAELTVPWEENMDWAHKRKLLPSEQLAQDCKNKGWRRDGLQSRWDVEALLVNQQLISSRGWGVMVEDCAPL